MRKIIYIAVLFLIVQTFCKAQVFAQSDVKAEDVLAAQPAQNQHQLDKTLQGITKLGESGLAQIASSIKPTGNASNAAAENVVSSYSFYVIQPGKEEQRQMAVRAYTTALGNLQDDDAKQFIIKQLQQIGKDESVPVLKPYLANERLAGPAAKALAQINTPVAADVLLKALAVSKGDIQVSIIEALGYAEYKPATAAIMPIATQATDVQLKKISYYALARIGGAASIATLQKAAQQAGYTYDYTEAVAAYILYLHRLAANGGGTQAETAATQLMKDAGTAGQIHTKIAALQLLVEIKGTASLPWLKAAMLDKDIKYRGAALSFAAKFRSPATDEQWLQLVPTIIPEAQVQVINFLAQTGNASLLPGIQKFVKNKNSNVRCAAILASGKLGGKAALSTLLETLKAGDTIDVAAVKTALLTLKANDITEPIAKALNEVPAPGKVVLLQVLAARGATGESKAIFSAASSIDTSVHNAASAALPSVVAKGDLPQLYALLNTSKPSDVANLQLAVVAASANITDTAARTQAILTALSTAPTDKQYRYYNVLGTIGGKAALSALQTAYANGSAEAKTADISALAKTNSAAAARILLAIAQQPGAGEDALNGYISIIQNSDLPSDQKLLMLKEAMAVATTDAQRKSVLVEVGECRTFLALVFAGKYLDNAAVQQEAAHAVMDIALSNIEFAGDIVINLLNKTADVLTGRDADYEKQSIKKHIADITGRPGFAAMFNGTDLTGWKGLVENPIVRAKMNPDTLAAAQAKADKIAHDGWFAKDGLLVFSGHGENLCTVKQYGDFEMFVDWKITKEGDAGIYLRGSPQVQIWDTSRRSVGAEVGSGGLYNNQKHQSKPLVLADNAIGEWNSFHIIMRGDKVTVYLNGVLVTDNVVLENYWDRSLPIFIKEQIELQAHGTYVAYRDLYIKELSGSAPFVMSNEEKKDGFSVLFDGSNLDQWTGNTIGYKIDQGSILVDTADGHPGNMYTKQQYSDFVLRFEFQLTPGANNGIGIRAPLEGDAAYVGMEIQVLDNEADEYKDLHAYQYHGSVYGVIPAKRGFLKPTGQWNYEEITAKGPHIKVVLNGEVILDGDIDEASKNGTADKREHPGLHNPSGHIGFLGHGSVVRFRNLRIKEL